MKNPLWKKVLGTVAVFLLLALLVVGRAEASCWECDWVFGSGYACSLAKQGEIGWEDCVQRPIGSCFVRPPFSMVIVVYAY